MTDFTEESKVQSPHWKSEDISDRTVTRGKTGAMTRGGMAKAIHNDIAAEVARIDIENAYGSKNTTDFTEETKGTTDFTEETKGSVDWAEESKGTVDWSEESK
jgi:hypothetical protein